MGEANQNPNALLSKMMPALPQRDLEVRLACAFAPKEDLLILPPDRIRVNEEGVTQVFGRVGTKPTPDAPIEYSNEKWSTPPATLRVHEEGKRLDPSDLDFVVVLQGVSINRTLTDDKGRHPARLVPIREMVRMDATSYLAQFEPTRDSGLIT